MGTIIVCLGTACDGERDPQVPSGTAGTVGMAGGAGTSPPAAGNVGGPPSNAGGTGGPPVAGPAGGPAPSPTAGGGGAGASGAGSAAPPNAGVGGQSGASGTAGAAGQSGSGDPGPASGPTLPAIDDPGVAGPFEVNRVENVSGLASHTLFVPDAVGSHGKHPTVVWTCGNGGSVSFYASFLDHVASHGFLVVADKGSSSDRLAEVASQKDAVDWLLAENAKSGGDFFGKIDLDNIAVMGHSLGSLASFATAAQNEHIATSVHFSGGLTGNPVGFDESWLADMTKPAAFLCGGSDTTAGPSCAQDFDSAPPALPVFYGVLAGASHIGPFGGTPRAGQYGRSGVAWLRWQLAEDPAFAPWFVGATCTLCASPWTAKQRNLN